jgi:hypothetical protein
VKQESTRQIASQAIDHQLQIMVDIEKAPGVTELFAKIQKHNDLYRDVKGVPQLPLPKTNSEDLAKAFALKPTNKAATKSATK